MKEIPSLETFSKDTTLLVGTDLTGDLKQYFKTAKQLPGCMIMLCTQGNCHLTIHLREYNLKANSVAVIFPEIICKMEQVSEDCQFIYAVFSKVRSTPHPLPEWTATAFLHVPECLRLQSSCAGCREPSPSSAGKAAAAARAGSG